MKSKSLMASFIDNTNQERKLIMATTITYVSTWVHTITGKTCKVIGTRETNSKITTFRIDGYNPLPCFEFKGTYRVLADWLQENNWHKLVKANIYTPDVVCIEFK